MSVSKIFPKIFASIYLCVCLLMLLIPSLTSNAQDCTNARKKNDPPGYALECTTGATTIVKPTTGTGITSGLKSGSGNGTGSISYLNLTDYDCFFPQQSNCNKPIYPEIIAFLKAISLPLVTLFIIFGGFEWINDTSVKRTSANATIAAAIGGYIVIMLSDKIVDVVTKTIKPDGFDPTAINALLDNLIDFGLNISTVFCVACLVIAGYSYYVEYFWNEGRQQDKLQPTNLIYGAVTGLVIITLARPLIAFVKSIFNVEGANLAFQNQPIINLIQNFLVRFAIPLSSIIAVVFLVIAGYFRMNSQGDAKKVEASDGMIKNAVIGFVVILLCTTMVQLITFFIKPVQGFISPDSTSSTITTTPKEDDDPSPEKP